MPHLTSPSTVAPITSVAFISAVPSSPYSHLLAGEGFSVNVISLTSPDVVRKKPIFRRDRIHGIYTSPTRSRVLFWGGRSIRACTTATVLDDGSVDGVEHKTPDWILSAVLLDDGTIAAVGAHNILMTLGPQDSMWKQVGCGERTMLYSADTAIGPDGKLTMAAGTVFGEVVVWAWGKGSDEGVVLHRLRGHEGSIFGVKFEEASERWLATCSDDRTVRVWDLEAVDEEAIRRESTGLGGPVVAGGTCVALGWGHYARPWTIRFLSSREDADTMELVSVGEDLTVRFWTFLKLKEGQDTVEMKNTQTHTLHAGKNIWGLAVDHERNVLATGGNDGRVCLLDYSDTVEPQQEWTLDEAMHLAGIADLEDRKSGGKKVQKDMWKECTLLDSHRVLATTAFGRVVSYDYHQKGWKYLGQREGLRNWGHIGAWDGTGVVALGDSKGQLVIIDVDHDREWCVDACGGGRKVGGLFTCGHDSDNFHVLTSSLGSQLFAFHSLKLPRIGSSDHLKKTCISLESPHPKFIITSATYSPSTHELFVGSRTGDILVYNLTASPPEAISATTCIRHLYTTDALTSLTFCPSTKNITSTSRSGVYAIHSLPTFNAIHISKPTPTISQIEGFTPPSTIHGFRGLSFITHSLSTSLDTLTISCGGSHRAWSFHPTGPTLAWTQSGSLHLHPPTISSRPRLQLLTPGHHGREIKTLAYNPHHNLLATGAEDTTIRFIRITARGTLQPAPTTPLKRHSSGVAALVWSPDGTRLFSAGALEEVFVFRVTAAAGVVLEDTLPPPGAAEVRVMDVDVVAAEARGYLVVVGTSEGGVRTVRYTPGEGWSGAVERVYGRGRCVAYTKLVRCAERILVVVAATDGIVAVYDAEREGEALVRQCVHQSAIKALAVCGGPDEGMVRVLTGGDDGAVGEVVFTVHDEAVEVSSYKLLEGAHPAAVVGVLEVTGMVVSVGGDARVKVWQWDTGELLHEKEGEIADIGDAVSVEDGRIVVAGVGMQVWDLTS